MSRFYVRIPLCCLHLNQLQWANTSINVSWTRSTSWQVTMLPMMQKSNDVLTGTWKTRSLGMLQQERSPKKTNRRYYPSRKDPETTLHWQFLHRRTMTTIKSLSSSRFMIGKKDLLKGGSSIEQEMIHLPHLIQQRKTPLKRAPFFLSIKSHGSSDCWSVMEASWFWWMPPTRPRLRPLFFICVHTNVGYTIVAEFMCQTEQQTSISKALAILRKWNPASNPTYFMVDYSSAKIGAIEEQFPGSTVYTCDFIVSKRCKDGPGQGRTTYLQLNKRCF